jgi:methylated-DNA-protein-cysteine methyltransferase-like protein
MEQMLASEGVKVNEDKVVDFKKVFWDPSIELAM